MSDRVDFKDDGTLDEVFASGGAHLERTSKNRWFLIFYHEDGTSSAFWFKSKELTKPFWEKRPKRGEFHGEPQPATPDKQPEAAAPTYERQG